MESIQHRPFAAWDFATRFTLGQVALLIIGVDPAIATDDDRKRCVAVAQRMNLSYVRAVAAGLLFQPPDDKEFLPPAESLLTVEFREMLGRAIRWKDARDFKRWLNTGGASVNGQTFLREDIATWLNAVSLESHYSFSFATKKSESKEELGRPLGSKERTNLLNLSGALLALLLEPGSDGRSRSGFKDEAAVKEAILLRHPKKSGLSSRTLDARFPEARRSLESD
ncbi:hypothetical protein [Variovorax atrisoli]|uniref:hypothetical protein n=1 Tax=Variovorax atrisoli TaxID=3394203 RepID=UPI00160EBE0F|nr:hypothetical protein [Variovorax sp. BK613]MBB3639829.1 hypothetical protein [Variovorax sp. BK613]